MLFPAGSAGSIPARATNMAVGIKEEKCEECEIKEWNGKSISFELEHIDGNRFNHKIENLKILCPNCHSQTKTYRGKNISNT